VHSLILYRPQFYSLFELTEVPWFWLQINSCNIKSIWVQFCFSTDTESQSRFTLPHCLDLSTHQIMSSEYRSSFVYLDYVPLVHFTCNHLSLPLDTEFHFRFQLLFMAALWQLKDYKRDCVNLLSFREEEEISHND